MPEPIAAERRNLNRYPPALWRIEADSGIVRGISCQAEAELVEKISKISASAPSIPTRIQHSISVAEPDIAWAAARQAVIDAGLEEQERSGEHSHPESEAEEEGHSARHLDLHQSHSAESVDEAEKLSGESERIGTGNLDEEDVPFGKHSGYI